MDETEIAAKYDMTAEDFKALDKEIRDNLTLGKGNTIEGINLCFPELNNTERAKIFILFHIAKHI